MPLKVMPMWASVRAWWLANPWVRWPVNGVSLILMVPLLVWLAAYGFSQDEPLRPEVQALLQPEPLPSEPDNAFEVLMGLSAPKDADAQRVGSLVVYVAVEQMARGRTPQEAAAALPQAHVLTVQPLEPICPQGQRVCLPQMRAQAAQVRQWEAAHDVVWTRFLEAARQPLWRDVDLKTPQMAQRLDQMSAAARLIAVERWSRRRHDEALSALEHTLHLCRMALSGTVVRSTKEAAGRCVVDGWTLASALALEASRGVRERHARAFARLAPLLLAPETAIAPVVRNELRARLPSVLDTPQARAWARPDNDWLRTLRHPFFQQRATVNRYYERMSAQARLDEASARELAAPYRDDHERNVWAWWRTGNPIGMWLLDFHARDEFVPLALSLRALEAHRRLYLLVLQCTAAGTLPKDPRACAQSAPRELHNPFDGRPPTWDEARGVLALPLPPSIKDHPELKFTPAPRTP